MPKQQREYLVKLEMNVTASNPREAAERAMDDLQDPSLTPWYFEVHVSGKPGRVTMIDIDTAQRSER